MENYNKSAEEALFDETMPLVEILAARAGFDGDVPNWEGFLAYHRGHLSELDAERVIYHVQSHPEALAAFRDAEAEVLREDPPEPVLEREGVFARARAILLAAIARVDHITAIPDFVPAARGVSRKASTTEPSMPPAPDALLKSIRDRASTLQAERQRLVKEFRSQPEAIRDLVDRMNILINSTVGELASRSTQISELREALAKAEEDRDELAQALSDVLSVTDVDEEDDNE